MNKTWTTFRHPKHEAKQKDLPQHIKDSSKVKEVYLQKGEIYF